MTLRLKLRGDKKAMIRFGDQIEEQWFIGLMRSIRDGDPKTRPPISIKDKGGEIPRLPPPKMVPQGKEGMPKMAQQGGMPIPPEMLEKMKTEKVKVEKKTNEMKK